MITLISRWIVPVTSPPIKDGAIVIDGGRIADYGPVRPIFKKYRSIRKDLGEVILMPALANAHTHLEFSCMRHKIKKIKGFVEWVRGLVREKERVTEEEIQDQAEEAIKQMYRSGVSLVGEVSNSLATMNLLARSPLRGIIFHEIFGLQKDSSLKHFARALQGRQDFQKLFHGSKRFRFSISPHAPQTVSPTLFKMIRRLQKKDRFIVTVHLSESPEEEDLIQTGRGPLKDYLEERGFWDPEWKAPRCSAVSYLDKLRFLSSKVLATHCVQVNRKDIDILKKRKVIVIVCPRSNRWLKVGKPPLMKLLQAGVKVALGTDSLASNHDLSIFNEMKFVKKEFPKLENEEILKMATIHGAEALGLEKYFGAIEKGKIPELLCIRVKGREKMKNPLAILTSGVSSKDVSRPM